MVLYYPYWSQIFLTAGIAVERFILICHGAKADIWLSKQNAIVYNMCITILAFAFPTFYFVDRVLNLVSTTAPFVRSSSLRGCSIIERSKKDATRRNLKCFEKILVRKCQDK